MAGLSRISTWWMSKLLRMANADMQSGPIDGEKCSIMIREQSATPRSAELLVFRG